MPTYSPDELDDLAQQWIAAGMPQTGALCDSVISVLLPLATKLAAKYDAHHGHGLTCIDDLRQEAFLRLAEACRSWRRGVGYSFQSWLHKVFTWRIASGASSGSARPLYGPAMQCYRQKLGIGNTPYVDLDNPELGDHNHLLIDHADTPPMECEKAEDKLRLRELENLLLPSLSSPELLTYSRICMAVSGATDQEMAILAEVDRGRQTQVYKSKDNAVERIKKKCRQIKDYLTGRGTLPRLGREYSYASHFTSYEVDKLPRPMTMREIPLRAMKKRKKPTKKYFYPAEFACEGCGKKFIRRKYRDLRARHIYCCQPCATRSQHRVKASSSAT